MASNQGGSQRGHGLFMMAAKLALVVALALILPHTGLAAQYGIAEASSGGQDPVRIAGWAVLAGIVHLLGNLLGVVRWRVLLEAQGLSVPFLRLVRAWFVGRFFTASTPGALGRDAYRLFDVSRAVGEVVRPTAALVVEKAMAFVAFGVVAFCAMVWADRFVVVDHLWLLAAASVMVVAAIGIAVLLLLPGFVRLGFAFLPVPSSWLGISERMGSAISAYASHRRSLVKAVVLGVAGQSCTILGYAGIILSLRAPSTRLIDGFLGAGALFVGPSLAPYVGGQGTVALVLANLLPVSPFAVARFGALWWHAAVVPPFVLGAAVLLLVSVRRFAPAQVVEARILPFDAERIRTYRRRTSDCIVGGLLGGLAAGPLIGLAEAGWLAHSMEHLSELQVLWWGPLAYGPILSMCGLSFSAALALLWGLNGRERNLAQSFVCGFGGTLGSGVLIIGRWRYISDVLDGGAVSLLENLVFVSLALGLGLGTERFLALTLGRLGLARRLHWGVVTGVLFVCVVSAGVLCQQALEVPISPASDLPSPPNEGAPPIVLVVIDTLRADALPLYSSDAQARTPHFEALAADSVFFPNSFSQAPWTRPSFGTLFTGLYPSTHGAVVKAAVLSDRWTTLAEVLRQRGYYTQGFANNRNIAATLGFGQGFAEYVFLEPDMILGARPSSFRLALYEVLRRVHRLFVPSIEVTSFYQPSEAVNDAVFEWLQAYLATGRAPFFLFVHYFDCHDPYMAAGQDGVAYALINLGHHPSSKHYLSPMRRAYADEVERVDRSLGALMERLRAQGLYDDAVIVVTADHGEELYDHDGWWHGQTLYEEQVHVPFIVKLPQNRRAGTVDPRLARHIDMMPTLLDLAGAEIPEGLPGRPLFAEGEVKDEPVTSSLAERDFGDYVLRSLRNEQYKIIVGHPASLPKLYDLIADPGETHDLSGTRRTEMERLMRQVEREQSDGRHP